MVAELAARKQEARLEHTHAGGWRERVKVLDLELCHSLTLVRQGGLVDVAVLTLEPGGGALGCVHAGGCVAGGGDAGRC